MILISSCSVGLVDVCGAWGVASGKCSVSPLNIFANVWRACVWRPGLRASFVCNLLTASSKSFATFVASSMGVASGISQCWGYNWYWPDVRIPPVDGI